MNRKLILAPILGLGLAPSLALAQGANTAAAT